MRLRNLGGWSFALCVALTFGVFATPAFAITWGEVDLGYVYDNVGMILYETPDGSVGFWCSGTLIHPKVFLTAGHCSSPMETGLAEGWIQTVYVSFDLDPLNSPWSWLEVASVQSHPEYNPQLPVTANPDTGVLILAEAVEDLEPADLAPIGYLSDLKAEGALRDGNDGVKFTIVGFGASLNWPPPEFEFEFLRQSSTSEYLALRNTYLVQSQNRRLGNGGACWYDSGGPAFMVAEDGSLVIVGTTSTGDYNCVATNISYRMDTHEAQDFINAVKAALD